jgi:hypothetical protein
MTEIPGALGLGPAEMRSLLAAAGRAPSLHNSQPWLFRLTPLAIELHADPERRLPVVDPEGHEMRLACGAALFNLRLALLGHHIRPVVTLFPDRDRPNLLAVVRHGGHKLPTPEQQRLLRAVPLRRTNRRPFSDVGVASPEQHALRRAAVDEGAWLHVVENPQQRAELRELASRAHAVQMADPDFRAEVERWTAVTPGRPDGVPLSAGGPLPEPQDSWVLRDFTGGKGPRRVPGKDFEEEPLVAVLTPQLSGPAADLQAGQALERVLLTATANGLATSFLSQVVEVGQTREALRRMIHGIRPPVSLLRIGHGWPVGSTPRRPVEDLLMVERGGPDGTGPSGADGSGAARTSLAGLGGPNEAEPSPTH